MKTLLIIAAVLAVVAVGGLLAFVYVVQNVETPDYVVVEHDGDLELRDYPPLVVAEVQRDGSRQKGLSAGFGPLARYIFAKERAGAAVAMTAPVEQQAAAKIAMTAPVEQSPAEAGWAVRFIMPREYRLADLPAPGNAEVRLREVPARRLAAVRFPGRTNDRLIAEQERRLTDWLAARGLPALGPPIYAYYNDPFTPGFLRRNEVQIEVPGPVGATSGPTTSQPASEPAGQPASRPTGQPMVKPGGDA